MRYLGGKSKLASRIAAVVEPVRRGRELWEPFCGGLGMVRAWGPGPLVLTDVCAPLIHLYRAIQAGWDPPEHVTREEHAAVRTLPDTDPRKAFIGFGCSFGGMWGHSYATGGMNANGSPRNYAAESRRAVLADVAACRHAVFGVEDFLAVTPEPSDGVIYADPPYRGTYQYEGVAPFDFDAFVGRVDGWARAGVCVFVSEFDFPIGECILEIPRTSSLSQKATSAHVDRLYRVGP